MTKIELMEQLKDVDDNSEIRIAHEGSIYELPIVGVVIENDKAVIEFREEE